MPFFWSFLLLALLAPARATDVRPAQGKKAHSELFVRAEGRDVRVAIRIEMQRGFHLYHDVLGSPTAAGQPTVVELSGVDATWSSVRFPEPKRLEQPFGTDGEPTWIWAHEGTIVLYARGRLAEGASAAKLSAKIAGQICDDKLCWPHKEALESSGPGTDELFAAFPADLNATAEVAAQPESSDATKASASTGAPLEVERPGNPQQKARSELFVRAEGGDARVAIQITMQSGWHLYHDVLGPPDAVGVPTAVALSGVDATWSRVRFPEPIRLEQEFGMDDKPTWIWAHEGTFVLYARGRLAEGADVSKLSAKITGLTCDDKGCWPHKEEIESSGRGADALFAAFPADLSASSDSTESPAPSNGSTPSVSASGAAADPSTAASAPAPGGAPLEVKRRGDLLGFLGLAVFWGLFTLLMPCTYPMIPITISFFTKQAGERQSKQLRLSLVYGLGIVLIFVLIGVVVGSAIIPFATHPLTNLVIGAAFVLFALALFGAIDLQPPRFLMNAAGQASRTGGYLGVFFMGATLVVTSFTCTAPFVGSLLSAAAAERDLVRIVLGMGVFGLTMAVPFVLLSLLPGRMKSLPRSGEWMHVLKVFLGFVELAAALKFVSNADLVWAWGVLTRELFLLLWAGIFLVAALFLLGIVRLSGERESAIGPARLIGGTCVLLFSLYCVYGVPGRELDRVMTAIIPNYSANTLGGSGAANGSKESGQHEIVKDDYDAALEAARTGKKLLLVDFTGFTCVNCRQMEERIFRTPLVGGILRESFVEARLHTDGQRNVERILALQQELAGSVATPYYVVVDPRNGAKIGVFEGATFDPNEFAEFLRAALKRADR